MAGPHLPLLDRLVSMEITEEKMKVNRTCCKRVKIQKCTEVRPPSKRNEGRLKITWCRMLGKERMEDLGRKSGKEAREVAVNRR